MFRYECPRCGELLETDAKPGTLETCPACGRKHRIPEPIGRRIKKRLRQAKRVRPQPAPAAGTDGGEAPLVLDQPVQQPPAPHTEPPSEPHGTPPPDALGTPLPGQGSTPPPERHATPPPERHLTPPPGRHTTPLPERHVTSPPGRHATPVPETRTPAPAGRGSGSSAALRAVAGEHAARRHPRVPSYGGLYTCATLLKVTGVAFCILAVACLVLFAVVTVQGRSLELPVVAGLLGIVPIVAMAVSGLVLYSFGELLLCVRDLAINSHEIAGNIDELRRP